MVTIMTMMKPNPPQEPHRPLAGGTGRFGWVSPLRRDAS